MQFPTTPPRPILTERSLGLELLRFGLGLVFVWFGAPKLIPGLSPAEGLVAATVTCCDPSWFVPTLGVVEVLIGLLLWSRRMAPLGLLLMAGHMCGTALPLITLPEVTWKAFPVATLEGQYIIKNVVLVAGAMVLAGAHLGRLEELTSVKSWPLRWRGPRPVSLVEVGAELQPRGSGGESPEGPAPRGRRGQASLRKAAMSARTARATAP